MTVLHSVSRKICGKGVGACPKEFFLAEATGTLVQKLVGRNFQRSVRQACWHETPDTLKMTSPRVLRQLFRTILRDAKKLSKDERKISTALRNGTARISSDSVGASAFQNGIQNLDRVGMLEEAIKARFRVHGSMRDDGANDFIPTQGGGTCGPRNKNTDMESTGVDKAFQVVYQLNTIRGALHCLEDSGAFDSLGRHILHMKDNCYSEHQVLSGNSRQSCNGAVASRPVRSNLYDPLFVVGEFVHHWCHGPALVFGWECESKEIQSVCGECADSSGKSQRWEFCV